jgi:protein gp37
MAKFWWWLKERGVSWPTNLWVGTSISMSRRLARVDHLLDVGDRETVHFLCVQPQLERIDLKPWLPWLDWCIQGGEFGGSQARRFQVGWTEDLQEDCHEAGTAYFLNQLGSYAFDGDDRIRLYHPHGGDWLEWPEHLRVRQVPHQGWRSAETSEHCISQSAMEV